MNVPIRSRRALQVAQLEVRADLLTKLALGFGLAGAARLLGLFSTFGLIGSVVGDAVLAFIIAAALGMLARRVRVRRDVVELTAQRPKPSFN